MVFAATLSQYAYISWTPSALWSLLPNQTYDTAWWHTLPRPDSFLLCLYTSCVYIYMYRNLTCMRHINGSSGLMYWSSRSEPMTNFDILFGPDRVDDSCTSMAQFIPIYQPSAGRHDHRLFICQSIFITQKIMLLPSLCLYGSLGSNYWPTRTFNALVSLYTEYTNIFLPANIG